MDSVSVWDAPFVVIIVVMVGISDEEEEDEEEEDEESTTIAVSPALPRANSSPTP